MGRCELRNGPEIIIGARRLDEGLQVGPTITTIRTHFELEGRHSPDSPAEHCVAKGSISPRSLSRASVTEVSGTESSGACPP